MGAQNIYGDPDIPANGPIGQSRWEHIYISVTDITLGIAETNGGRKGLSVLDMTLKYAL